MNPDQLQPWVMLYFVVLFCLLPLILILTFTLLPWLLFRKTRTRAHRPHDIRFADAFFMGNFCLAIGLLLLFYILPPFLPTLIYYTFSYYATPSSRNTTIAPYVWLALFVIPILATLCFALDYRRQAMVIYTLFFIVSALVWIGGVWIH